MSLGVTALEMEDRMHILYVLEAKTQQMQAVGWS